MRKNITTIISFALLLLASSCQQNDDALQISPNTFTKNVFGDVIPYDSLQSTIKNDIIAAHISFCTKNDSLYNLVIRGIKSQKALRVNASDASLGGPYTVTGYTSKTYLNSHTVMFPVSAALQARGLQPYVYYIADVYLYKYRVTVPHGATIVWQTTTNMSNMGQKPSNLSLYNYDAINVSLSNDGDVYDLTTQVTEVTHLATGQQITTAYIPINIVDPTTFQFKYAWALFSW